MGSIALPLTGSIDVALTNYAKGYDQPDLIWRRVAPVVTVGKESGLFWVHGREPQENINNDRRPRGGRAEKIRISKSTTAFRCTSHSLEAAIPDEDEAAYELGSLAEEAVETCMSQILTKLEVRLATALGDTAKITQNATLAGGDQWSDYVNSSPLTLVNDQKRTILLGSGRAANLLILGADVFFKLLNHPSVKEQFKYTQPGGLTINNLKSVFFPEGNGDVVVGQGVVVDKAGTATFAWGKNAVLAYVDPQASRRDPSAFRTLVWGGAPATSGGIGVMRYRDPYASAKAEIGSADMYYDEDNFVVNAAAAYLFKNAVA